MFYYLNKLLLERKQSNTEIPRSQISIKHRNLLEVFCYLEYWLVMFEYVFLPKKKEKKSEIMNFKFELIN